MTDDVLELARFLTYRTVRHEGSVSETTGRASFGLDLLTEAGSFPFVVNVTRHKKKKAYLQQAFMRWAADRIARGETVPAAAEGSDSGPAAKYDVPVPPLAALKIMLNNTVLNSGLSLHKLAKKLNISDYKLQKVLSFDRRCSLQRMYDVCRACGKDLKICCTGMYGDRFNLADYLVYPMGFTVHANSMDVYIPVLDERVPFLEFKFDGCSSVTDAQKRARRQLLEYFEYCMVEPEYIPMAFGFEYIRHSSDLLVPVTIKADKAFRALLHDTMYKSSYMFDDLAEKLGQEKLETARLFSLYEPFYLEKMMAAFEKLHSRLEISVVPAGAAAEVRTPEEIKQLHYQEKYIPMTDAALRRLEELNFADFASKQDEDDEGFLDFDEDFDS